MDMQIHCDIPFCVASEHPTGFGDNSNITCAVCNKFTCGSCTRGTFIDKGGVDGVPGMTIRTFTCPFCRSFWNECVFA